MKTIIETIKSDKSLKNFTFALEKAKLTELLGEKGPFSVFAPTDEAFNRLSSEHLDSILSNKNKIISLLKNHLINEKIKSADLKKTLSVRSLEGQDLKIEIKKWLLEISIKIDCARIIEADIECTNGVIHKVNFVLIPQGL